MAKQSINLGSSANDGGGTTLRAGGDIVNDNFNELYTALGNGTALQISLGSPSTGDVLTYNGSIFTTATPSTLSNIVEDTTPQLGGNLDVQTSVIKSSGTNLQLGEGISSSGITGSGASRIKGFAAFFGRNSDNSQRHYNSGWFNKQTLTANIDAANKKQGWVTDSTLDAAGYTHGTNDTSDTTKLFGDYSYTNVVSSGSSATINGVVGHHFQAEIFDGSANSVNATHVIGLRSRASNYKAGSTVTNAYGLYVDTAKDGAATITNRYSIYAPQSSDKAYFAGPVQVGAWTLPTADGTNGQVLKTDGSGNLDWVNNTAGGSLSGLGVNSTAAELNIMDGDNSASATTIVDADRIISIHNI
jgi:hypothetical protein